jgi:hypothetical protein
LSLEWKDPTQIHTTFNTSLLVLLKIEFGSEWIELSGKSLMGDNLQPLAVANGRNQILTFC